ncbi:hypothetical protein [Methylotenera sp.]|uniref:hypothetical protein n=1 Tax=Methylotenera sp. TaxID=2051956 RepID=UPI002488D95F|nr:hypothetical protein [Methylotenera sp.]MDI1361518.1 hypothetical protein [Methylotenera sp.]
MPEAQLIPIVISVVALCVSLASLYVQHLRRVRHGTVSVLWSSWKYKWGEPNVEVKLDLAFSNQGNRPYVISRTWLLIKSTPTTKTRFEPSEVHQGKPLRVAPHSVEFIQLNFEVSASLLQKNGEERSKSEEGDIQLLIYAADDLGREQYAQPKVMRMAMLDDHQVHHEHNQVTTSIIGAKNKKEWKLGRKKAA